MKIRRECSFSIRILFFLSFAIVVNVNMAENSQQANEYKYNNHQDDRILEKDFYKSEDYPDDLKRIKPIVTSPQYDYYYDYSNQDYPNYDQPSQDDYSSSSDYDEYGDQQQDFDPKRMNSGAVMHGLERSIPGTAGIDYPNFQTMPRTEFRCQDHDDPGLYGDIETECQMFHICQEDGRHDSFLCPVGTIFNQKHFICDWWFNYNCSETPQFYSLNAMVYTNREGVAREKGVGHEHGRKMRRGNILQTDINKKIQAMMQTDRKILNLFAGLENVQAMEEKPSDEKVDDVANKDENSIKNGIWEPMRRYRRFKVKRISLKPNHDYASATMMPPSGIIFDPFHQRKNIEDIKSGNDITTTSYGNPLFDHNSNTPLTPNVDSMFFSTSNVEYATASSLSIDDNGNTSTIYPEHVSTEPIKLYSNAEDRNYLPAYTMSSGTDSVLGVPTENYAIINNTFYGTFASVTSFQPNINNVNNDIYRNFNKDNRIQHEIGNVNYVTQNYDKKEFVNVNGITDNEEVYTPVFDSERRPATESEQNGVVNRKNKPSYKRISVRRRPGMSRLKWRQLLLKKQQEGFKLDPETRFMLRNKTSVYKIRRNRKRKPHSGKNKTKVEWMFYPRNESARRTSWNDFVRQRRRMFKTKRILRDRKVDDSKLLLSSPFPLSNKYDAYLTTSVSAVQEISRLHDQDRDLVSKLIPKLQNVTRSIPVVDQTTENASENTHASLDKTSESYETLPAVLITEEPMTKHLQRNGLTRKNRKSSRNRVNRRCRAVCIKLLKNQMPYTIADENEDKMEGKQNKQDLNSQDTMDRNIHWVNANNLADIGSISEYQPQAAASGSISSMDSNCDESFKDGSRGWSIIIDRGTVTKEKTIKKKCSSKNQSKYGRKSTSRGNPPRSWKNLNQQNSLNQQYKNNDNFRQLWPRNSIRQPIYTPGTWFREEILLSSESGTSKQDEKSARDHMAEDYRRWVSRSDSSNDRNAHEPSIDWQQKWLQDEIIKASSLKQSHQNFRPISPNDGIGFPQESVRNENDDTILIPESNTDVNESNTYEKWQWPSTLRQLNVDNDTRNNESSSFSDSQIKNDGGQASMVSSNQGLVGNDWRSEDSPIKTISNEEKTDEDTVPLSKIIWPPGALGFKIDWSNNTEINSSRFVDDDGFVKTSEQDMPVDKIGANKDWIPEETLSRQWNSNKMHSDNDGLKLKTDFARISGFTDVKHKTRFSIDKTDIPRTANRRDYDVGWSSASEDFLKGGLLDGQDSEMLWSSDIKHQVNWAPNIPDSDKKEQRNNKGFSGDTSSNNQDRKTDWASNYQDSQSWSSNRKNFQNDRTSGRRDSDRLWSSDNQKSNSDFSTDENDPRKPMPTDDSQRDQSNWSADNRDSKNDWPPDGKQNNDDWSSSGTGDKNDWSSDSKGSKNDWSSDSKESKNDWSSDSKGSKNDWSSDSEGSKSDWSSDDKVPTIDWSSDNKRSKSDWSSDSKGSKIDRPSSNRGSKSDWSSDNKGSKSNRSRSSSKENVSDRSSDSKGNKNDWSSDSEESKSDWSSDDKVPKTDWSSDDKVSKTDWSSDDKVPKTDWSSDDKVPKIDWPSDSKTSKGDWSSDSRGSRNAWSSNNNGSRNDGSSGNQGNMDDWSFDEPSSKNDWSTDSQRGWTSDNRGSQKGTSFDRPSGRIGSSYDNHNSEDWSSSGQNVKKGGSAVTQGSRKRWSSVGSRAGTDWSSNGRDSQPGSPPAIENTKKRTTPPGKRDSKNDWSTGKGNSAKDWSSSSSPPGAQKGRPSLPDAPKDWSSDRQNRPSGSKGTHNSRPSTNNQRSSKGSSSNNRGMRRDWSSSSPDSNMGPKNPWSLDPSGSSDRSKGGSQKPKSGDNRPDRSSSPGNTKRDWSQHKDKKNRAMNTMPSRKPKENKTINTDKGSWMPTMEKKIQWSVQIGGNGKPKSGWIPITLRPRLKSPMNTKGTMRPSDEDEMSIMDEDDDDWNIWSKDSVDDEDENSKMDTIDIPLIIDPPTRNDKLLWVPPSDSEPTSSTGRLKTYQSNVLLQQPSTNREWSVPFDGSSIPESGWMPIFNINNTILEMRKNKTENFSSDLQSKLITIELNGLNISKEKPQDFSQNAFYQTSYKILTSSSHVSEKFEDNATRIRDVEVQNEEATENEPPKNQTSSNNVKVINKSTRPETFSKTQFVIPTKTINYTLVTESNETITMKVPSVFSDELKTEYMQVDQNKTLRVLPFSLIQKQFNQDSGKKKTKDPKFISIKTEILKSNLSVQPEVLHSRPSLQLRQANSNESKVVKPNYVTTFTLADGRLRSPIHSASNRGQERKLEWVPLPSRTLHVLPYPKIPVTTSQNVTDHPVQDNSNETLFNDKKEVNTVGYVIKL